MKITEEQKKQLEKDKIVFLDKCEDLIKYHRKVYLETKQNEQKLNAQTDLFYEINSNTL